MIELDLPLRLGRGLNDRGHWAAKARRVKLERGTVELALRAAAPRGMAGALRREPAATATVHLTRIAPRSLDGDNLQGSLKGVRDACASFLGCDDGSSRIVWTYAQSRRRPHEYAVLVVIEVSP